VDSFLFCLFPATNLARYFLQPLTLRADGLHRVTPFGEAWGHVTGIAWSPDSTELALSWSVGGVHTTPEGYIYIVGVEGRKARILKHTETAARIYNPAWSATGRIAFYLEEGTEKDVGIWLVDANDDQEREFVGEGTEYAWAPDGERLAIVDLVQATEYVISILDMQTGKVTKTYHISGNGNRVQGGGISWSPAGDWLAFSLGIAGKRAYTTSNMDIYVLDLVSGDSRRLTHGGQNIFPSWSPDGTMITFSGGTSYRDQTLVVLRPDDAEIVQPLDTASVGPVAWSPDGQWIAFEYSGHAYILETKVALEDWGQG
jgi:Tol biopolymer transport system component